MRAFFALAASVVFITAAAAQPKPANPDPATPAVTTPNSPNNPGAPAAGANSFTEGQAKSRLEDSGFSNISDLTKDQNGVWRGKGSKGGKSVDVSVDYQGNITPR
jgi:opacity protein-like surface antigen